MRNYGDSYRQGYPCWVIHFYGPTQFPTGLFEPQSTGEWVHNPLDIWVRPPQGATGYKLYPADNHERGTDVIPFPTDPEFLNPPRGTAFCALTTWHKETVI